MKKYYTYAEIASAVGKSVSTIRNRSKSEGWNYIEKTATGFPLRLFIYDNLPDDVKDALQEQQRIEDELNAIEEEAARDYEAERNQLWDAWERATGAARDKAAYRANILRDIVGMFRSGMNFTDAAKEIADKNSISPQCIYKWYYGNGKVKGAKHFDNCDWNAALLPQYKRTRPTRANCSDEVWAALEADYLRAERPDFSACYERVRLLAKRKKWDLPSVRTLRRWFKTIDRVRVVRARYGERAAIDIFPKQERTVKDMRVMQAIVGDGYRHNVFVIWPGLSKPIRPMTWVFSDVKSRKILGWCTGISENSDIIRQAFADVVAKYGIPDDIYLDNTRSAANKWLTGGVKTRYRFKPDENEVCGVFKAFGSTTHFTAIIGGDGNGPAKPIERAFGIGGVGEHIDKHPALAKAFTGRNTGDKPHNYNPKNAASYETFMEVFLDGIKILNAIPGRRTELGCGKYSLNQIFDEEYQRVEIRKATQQQMRLLLMPGENATVNFQGTLRLNAGKADGGRKNRYGHDALMQHENETVKVHFDPKALHGTVYVYSSQYEFICEAVCIAPVAFNSTEDAREHARARNHWNKANKAREKADRKILQIEDEKLYAIGDEFTDDKPVANVVAPMFHKAVNDETSWENDEEKRAELFAIGLEKLKKQKNFSDD